MTPELRFRGERGRTKLQGARRGKGWEEGVQAWSTVCAKSLGVGGLTQGWLKL